MGNDYYVYAYTRSRNSERGPKGSPYYIGKGRKMRAYVKRNNRPSRPENIVILVAGLVEQEALDIEKSLIAFYGKINNGSGYLHNITDGGEGVTGARWKRGTFTDDHKSKLRAAFAIRPSHPQSKDAREKISARLKGVPLSSERVAKIAASKRGIRCSINTEFKKGSPGPWLGRKRSDETKARVSAGLKAYFEKRRQTA